MTTTAPATLSLLLVVAHHGDDEFYDLGEITHEVPPGVVWAALLADPSTECCRATDSGHDLCWLVDQYVVAPSLLEQAGLGDTREITAERAAQLLGCDPWAALEEARRDLAEVYRRMA